MNMIRKGQVEVEKGDIRAQVELVSQLLELPNKKQGIDCLSSNHFATQPILQHLPRKTLAQSNH